MAFQIVLPSPADRLPEQHKTQIILFWSPWKAQNDWRGNIRVVFRRLSTTAVQFKDEIYKVYYRAVKRN